MLYTRDNSQSFNSIADATAWALERAKRDGYVDLWLYNSKRRSQLAYCHLRATRPDLDEPFGELVISNLERGTERRIAYQLISGPEAWAVRNIRTGADVARVDTWREAMILIYSAACDHGHGHNAYPRV